MNTQRPTVAELKAQKKAASKQKILRGWFNRTLKKQPVLVGENTWKYGNVYL